MIAINLNATKNIIKIAILATLTYLAFNISNIKAIPHIKYTTEDTATTPPKYIFF
jgi:hypothetical protein